VGVVGRRHPDRTAAAAADGAGSVGVGVHAAGAVQRSHLVRQGVVGAVRRVVGVGVHLQVRTCPAQGPAQGAAHMLVVGVGLLERQLLLVVVVAEDGVVVPGGGDGVRVGVGAARVGDLAQAAFLLLLDHLRLLFALFALLCPTILEPDFHLQNGKSNTLKNDFVTVTNTCDTDNHVFPYRLQPYLLK